jgi:hypothetical protein
VMHPTAGGQAVVYRKEPRKPTPLADFFRGVLICLWHKTRPLGQYSTAKNSPIKYGGCQALKLSF